MRIYADLNVDTWGRGYVTVPAGKTGTLYVFERRKSLAAADVQKFPSMHGIPGGKMRHWAGIDDPIVAKGLKVAVSLRGCGPWGAGGISKISGDRNTEMPALSPYLEKYRFPNNSPVKSGFSLN